jgi:hypothetical protein
MIGRLISMYVKQQPFELITRRSKYDNIITEPVNTIADNIITEPENTIADNIITEPENTIA